MKKVLLLLLVSFGILLAACSAEVEDKTSNVKIDQEKEHSSEKHEHSHDDEDHSHEEESEPSEEIGSENIENEAETTQADSSDVVEITIDSFNFGYSLEEIKVKKGDTIRLTLTNSGGNHDFVIDEIEGARTSVISTGSTDEIEFTATETGEFEFYCSVGSHRAAGMVGKFIVE